MAILPARSTAGPAGPAGRGNGVKPRGRALSRAGRVAVLVAACAVGIFSLRYLVPNPPAAVTELESYTLHHGMFVMHAICAAIALILGPLQFFKQGRTGGRVHRLRGRCYAAAVCAAWISSVPIAIDAHTGHVAAMGFLFLGALWAASTAIGVFAIRNRLLDQHRAWMLRSFALTCAAITLRLQLALSGVLDLPMPVAYPYIAWLCWIPNLLIAEWIIWKSRAKSSGVVRRGHALGDLLDG